MSTCLRLCALASVLALLASGCAKKADKRESATLVTTPVAANDPAPQGTPVNPEPAARPPDVVVVPAAAAGAADPQPVATPVVAVSAVAAAPVAGPVNLSDLKYRFKAGERYVYAVTIVADRPDAIETFKGQIELAVKSVSGNEFTMVPTTSLPKEVKQKQAAPRRIGPPSFGPPHFTGTSIQPQRAFTVNAHGKVMKMTGETPLSYMLGDAALLMIEPLSPDGAVRWDVADETFIRETKEQQGTPFPRFMPPRAPRFPGPGGPGGLPAPAAPAPKDGTVTTAKESIIYQVTDAKDGVVRIKKTYDLKMLTSDPNATPRLQMQGTGDLVFDVQAGVMKSCDYKPVITVSLENVQVKVPVTVSYNLLSAAETAALNKEREQREAELKKQAQERLAKLKEGQQAAAAIGEDTQFVGEPNTLPKQRSAQAGKPMIGVDYREGQWAGEPSLARIFPIYEEKAHQGAGYTRVLAKPGYAVGAVNVRTKKYVNAIQLVFMKLTPNGRLDPKDSYTSAWLGQEKVGTKETKLGGDGRLVIGVSCQQVAVIDAMALVMEKK